MEESSIRIANTPIDTKSMQKENMTVRKISRIFCPKDVLTPLRMKSLSIFIMLTTPIEKLRRDIAHLVSVLGTAICKRRLQKPLSIYSLQTSRKSVCPALPKLRKAPR